MQVAARRIRTDRREYVTDFERMAAGRTLLFLGMLWGQRHTDGVSLWVTPFMGGEPARLQLEAVMNFAAQAEKLRSRHA